MFDFLTLFSTNQTRVKRACEMFGVRDDELGYMTMYDLNQIFLGCIHKLNLFDNDHYSYMARARDGYNLLCRESAKRRMKTRSLAYAYETSPLLSARHPNPLFLLDPDVWIHGKNE